MKLGGKNRKFMNVSTFFRTCTVNDVINVLNDDSNFINASIYLESPELGQLTDEDSGVQNCDGATVDNVSGRQLGMPVIASVHYPGETLSRSRLPEDPVEL